MSAKFVKELRSLGKEELGQKINELQRRLFELRVQVVTQHVPNHPTAKRALRKQIAQGLTICQQLYSEGGL
jgi:ribosomal protein L29